MLVLDEGTSALDPETERALYGVLAGLGADTTVITVAHRLETVRRFPRVVVFDAGRVVATGTFDEMSSGCEPFRRLVAAGSAPSADGG